MKRITLTIAFLAAIHLAGCNGAKPGSMFPWNEDAEQVERPAADDSDLGWSFGLQKKKELDEPVKMFVTWSDSVYTQVGAPATRGFAARIYFYNKNYEPISVDGSLVVYGFDDTHNDRAKRSADKKFVFEPDHLASRHSVTQIGPSYSVWVPWDAVGSEQKNIALLPVFRSTKGQIVRGEQVVSILRGKQNDSIDDKERRAMVGDSPTDHGVRPVAFHAPIDSRESQRAETSSTKAHAASGMKTTTIRVPHSTMRHLQAPLAPFKNPSAGVPLSMPIAKPAPLPSSGESSHYIFDNHRSPIRPRDARRYATTTNSASTPATSTQAAATQPIPAARERLVHSGPQIPQAPEVRHVQPNHVPAQWQQYRAILPSVPPTPRQ